MIIVIPLEGRVRAILHSTYLLARRLSETKYSLSGDAFNMTDVTADQVFILPDTVQVSEGEALTEEMKLQALPLETFVATSPEEALADTLGLVLRAYVADGRITDKELLRVQPALEGRLWQPNLDVQIGDVYAFANYLWRCIQAHQTQGSWLPDLTPALWRKVKVVDDSIRVWDSGIDYLNSTSPFSGKIRCGGCGGMYGSKVWHSTSKYRRVIWQCNAKFQNGDKCDTPHLTEEAIQQKFIEAYNLLLSDRLFIIQDTKLVMEKLTSTKALETDINKLREDMEVTAALMQQAISQNASMALDQEEYSRRYNSLMERFYKNEQSVAALEHESAGRNAKRKELKTFITSLKNSDKVVTEFTPMLWNSILDCMKIGADENAQFVFKNGMTISV